MGDLDFQFVEGVLDVYGRREDIFSDLGLSIATAWHQI